MNELTVTNGNAPQITLEELTREEPVAEGFGDLFLSAVGADFSADVLASMHPDTVVFCRFGRVLSC